MVFIVIPVFNRKEFTRNCLNSLLKQTFKEYEIIIVDDGSTDGTSSMIKDEFPAVHLIRGDGNLWWAGATNAGIEYAFRNLNAGDSDHILTLNNDLEAPENYLSELNRNANIYNKAILGSISVDITDPGYMDFCGITWSEITGKYHLKAKDFDYSYKKLVDEMSIIESDTLPGRGTLIPVGVFNEIGLFDAARFPQYAADEDLALRARKKGWKLIIPTHVYLKSHIKETGVNMEEIRFGLKYYKQLFFSIKSPLNLKIRYRWAMKHTRLKLIYFFIESARLFLSVSFKMLKNSLN